MRFSIRALILIICLIGAILIIAPSFLDNAALEHQIERDLNRELRADVRIDEGVHILFLPSPRIIINHVNNSLFLKQLTYH